MGSWLGRGGGGGYTQLFIFVGFCDEGPQATISLAWVASKQDATASLAPCTFPNLLGFQMPILKPLLIAADRLLNPRPSCKTRCGQGVPRTEKSAALCLGRSPTRRMLFRQFLLKVLDRGLCA